MRGVQHANRKFPSFAVKRRGSSVLPEQPRAGVNSAAESLIVNAPEPTAPAIDIGEQDRAITITARFPGASQEDLRIESEHDAILILVSGKGYSGRFFIPLPALASVYDATWIFRGGILQLTVPLRNSAAA